MDAKKYPVIVRIFWGKSRPELFSKLNATCPDERDSKIAYKIAVAIQDVNFDVPIEIALLTQSSSSPNCIEVLCVDGIIISNIHTPVNFVFSDIDKILKMKSKEIQNAFTKEFSNFCKKLSYILCDERDIVRQKDTDLTSKIDALEDFSNQN
ncbi:hypothetical protein KKH36_01105 [Patescibacteria group bacterium]|nr:hypothetical protein [Patescibacteria group bacterium]